MDIKCKFITVLSKYTCDVSKSTITKPNVDIANFKGKHRPGRDNYDVTHVIFATRVEYFPRNLQKFFPNLDTLIIDNCGLKEISREDLVGLEKLVHLDLEKNQLTSLPDDLFSNMPNLKNVWLGGNKIEFASSKLIEPIVGNQLECFAMNKNTSIDEYYSLLNTIGNYGCKTIQELMAKIDKKCKPPKPRMISKTAPCGSVNQQNKFLKGFNEFRLLSRFTDFVIVVGPKEFPVNKNVLVGQSPVLAKMFKVKKNGRFASKLEISDLSAEAVEAFLDYLNERKLPGAQNAVEIFKLATKYEVAKLKTICEGIIRANLDKSNAFEVFKLACGSQKSEKLKVAAFEKLQEKFGGELDDDLINDPEKLQKIVEAKNVLDELMNKTYYS